MSISSIETTRKSNGFFSLFFSLNSMDFNVRDDTIVNSTLQLTFKKLSLAFWCRIKKQYHNCAQNRRKYSSLFQLYSCMSLLFFPLMYCNKKEHRKTAETYENLLPSVKPNIKVNLRKCRCTCVLLSLVCLVLKRWFF